MSFELIESKTLGTAQASIEFTLIPSTFTDLVVLLSSRNSGASNDNEITRLRFNTDTGNNYSWRRLMGTGSGVDSVAASSTDYILGSRTPNNGRTANTFDNAQFYVPNYTSGVAKSVSVDFVEENNATAAFQGIVAGLWTGTTAINSIQISIITGNYVVGTTASLYGVLKGSDGIVTTS